MLHSPACLPEPLMSSLSRLVEKEASSSHLSRSPPFLHRWVVPIRCRTYRRSAPLWLVSGRWVKLQTRDLLFPLLPWGYRRRRPAVPAAHSCSTRHQLCALVSYTWCMSICLRLCSPRPCDPAYYSGYMLPQISVRHSAVGAVACCSLYIGTDPM